MKWMRLRVLEEIIYEVIGLPVEDDLFSKTKDILMIHAQFTLHSDCTLVVDKKDTKRLLLPLD